MFAGSGPNIDTLIKKQLNVGAWWERWMLHQQEADLCMVMYIPYSSLLKHLGKGRGKSRGLEDEVPAQKGSQT